MNIILIGFMGSGKTTVGKMLAERLGYKYLDTDRLVEQTEEKTITDIFAQNGEEYFRNIETETLKTLKDYDNFIISCGGGIVLKEENIELLKELGKVILLDASPEAILERTKNSTHRPLLENGDKLQNIKAILSKREAMYNKSAEFKINTSRLRPIDVVEEILKYVKS